MAGRGLDYVLDLGLKEWRSEASSAFFGGAHVNEFGLQRDFKFDLRDELHDRLHDRSYDTLRHEPFGRLLGTSVGERALGHVWNQDRTLEASNVLDRTLATLDRFVVEAIATILENSLDIPNPRSPRDH